MALEKFHFKGIDGVDYAIPRMDKLPLGAIRKTRHLDDKDPEKFFLVLEEAIGEGSPELNALDRMDQDMLEGIFEEWTNSAPLAQS